MLQKTVLRVLALLWCLGLPLGARAQDEDTRTRIQEIRTLAAKLQDATQGPATLDKKSKDAPAQWYRLRAWDVPPNPDAETGSRPEKRLRKIVVNSRDKNGELERTFFLQGDDAVFFAFYVTTPPGGAKGAKKDEERIYFDNTVVPLRWQHNKDIRPMDGHALRWGEQARSDAKVAVSLVDHPEMGARFVPITCFTGPTECREDLPGNYCVTTYSLFPPPGFPVQTNLCMESPFYADQGTDCSVSQEGLKLTVTESWEQACDGPDCDPRGENDKELTLTPEMGQVKECPVFGNP